MNTQETNIADRVLTAIAHGYVMDKDLTGHVLFPEVFIDSRHQKVIKFGKEAYLKHNLRRAPGSNIKDIEIGYEGSTVDLCQDALHGKIPLETGEEANKQPGVSAARDLAIDPIMEIMKLSTEADQAKVAQDPANYHADNKVTLVGNDSWFDHENSNPLTDVVTAKKAIRKKTGHEPNVMHVCPDDYDNIRLNKNVIAHFAKKQNADVDHLTEKDLAAYFGVDKFIVGKSVFVETLDSDFEDNWTTTILAYVPEGRRNIRRPSYGYTYRLRGHILVTQAWFNNGNRSWMYPIFDERQVNLTGMSSGYLIQQG